MIYKSDNKGGVELDIEKILTEHQSQIMQLQQDVKKIPEIADNTYKLQLDQVRLEENVKTINSNISDIKINMNEVKNDLKYSINKIIEDNKRIQEAHEERIEKALKGAESNQDKLLDKMFSSIISQSENTNNTNNEVKSFSNKQFWGVITAIVTCFIGVIGVLFKTL